MVENVMKMDSILRYAVLLVLSTSVLCQIRRDARWCVVNDEEMAKCQALVSAIEERDRRGQSYPSGFGYDDLPRLLCVQANDHFSCMQMISENNADLVQLEPGMGYTAGEYYNMMPLMAEKYNTLPGDSGLSYYAVAVVKKDSDITFDTLKEKKSCHTGVGRAAGWVYPISTLIEAEQMPIVECNVPVKSAAGYFGPMCAPNGLARYYNPFGNNPVSVCANCDADVETHCTTNDRYAGYNGAFNCLTSGRGDVAFVRHTTIMQATANNSDWDNDDFMLVCTDGNRRASYDQASTCNWGQINSHIVMTGTVIDAEIRSEFKELLKLISKDFGEDGDHKDIFEVFSSKKYGRADLMFTDETKMLRDVADVEGGTRQTYYTWVGDEHRRRLLVLNTCPIQQARFCVISRYEMEKCEDMIMAFAAKSLKPDLNCILGTGVRDCMDKIRMGDADMITLDAADVFVAGKYYGLVPIAAEDYSGYDAGTYYAVALARRTDSHLTLFNLKQRRSCHSMVMSAAGWVIPVDKLIETGQIHIKDCNAYFSVGQFFSKSCVPGALHSHYNSEGTNPINLCEACAAGGNDRCMRNNNELYYGNSGAFRCLTERGGDVAFVKHTTARENTDGRNIAEWARNRRSDDYELLCNDGTRRDIDSWEECNLGSVPSNAVVTADFKNKQAREIFWTLLNFAQQFFASDSNDDFPMFRSALDHKDLIFQDSTVRLIKVEDDDQTYQEYLGGEFLRSMERMESIDCVTDNHAAHCHQSKGLLVSVLLCACVMLFARFM